MTTGTLDLVRSNANGFSLGSSARACLHHAANEIEFLTQALEQVRPTLVNRSVVLTAQEPADHDELTEVEQAIMLIDAALARTAPAKT